MHATSTKVAGAVCTWAQHCLPTVAVVAFAGEVLIVLRLPTAYGPTAIARELLINAVWIIIALLARRLRPDRPIWLIMLAFAVLLTLIGPVGLGVQKQSWFTAVLVTVGIGLVPYQVPLAAQILLAFPSGRLLQRPHRRLILVGYVYASIESVALLLTTPPDAARCADGCGANLANIVEDADLYVVVTRVAAIGWIVLITCFVVLYGQRYARAGTRERRVLRPSYLASIVVVSAFVWLSVEGARHGGNVFGAGPAPYLAAIVVLQLAIACVPLCFLLGLLRERLAYSGVSDLVRNLDRADEDARDLTKAVAQTLGDPTLQIAVRTDEGLVDLNGGPVVPRPGSQITPVGDSDQPVAVIVHEPSLHDDPELLVAARSALRLALDNKRLRSEVVAQLAAVQESRARIVIAGDEARRRLERDLHDGAQQRLLTVGLALQLLRLRLADNAASDLLIEAECQLAHAIKELRALAAGIHPAVLTDRGLLPAITALASRCPLPVMILGEDPGRLSPPIESAAYFCVSEGVTNAIKHAVPARVTIELCRAPGLMTVTVTDDGPGGADAAGGGLRGLADRVSAVKGRFAVSGTTVGTGTRLTVELPCD